ncbi:MAG: hypothetical protein P8106_01805 [Gammaproteobacteria bacterium]|jgi:hypothetical protein
MVKVLAASAVIFVVLAGWLYVEALYRRFAARHPEAGPFRESGGGCGGGCRSCSGGSCGSRKD